MLPLSYVRSFGTMMFGAYLCVRVNVNFMCTKVSVLNYCSVLQIFLFVDPFNISCYMKAIGLQGVY